MNLAHYINRVGLIPAVLLFAALLSSPRSADAADFPVADKVVVEKGIRKLHLLRNNEIFRSFDIALGLAPEGDKQEEGDFKTPEGEYYLDTRNPDSDYFLSIRISYPDCACPDSTRLPAF